MYTNPRAFEAAAEKMIAYLVNNAPRADDGTLSHLMDKIQFWIDAVYMVSP
jgi:rhamnogalacturonyl hydrolase YesR